MTFSVTARCARTGQLGIGAVTGAVGVGKLVPYARAGVGAVASQATVNPFLGIDGLALLGRGHTAGQALHEVLQADPGREVRQCSVLAADGEVAVHTGSRCPGWAGHRSGPAVVVAGNRLAGPEVLDAALQAFLADPERDLVDRVLAALTAGERAGGDRCEERSGAVLVVDEEEYPLWDLRIDDAEHPCRALHDLADTIGADLLPAVRAMPTRADPTGSAAREILRR